jgi:antitoxin component YwqK of YwqJK toxin-antitoxin module
MNEHYYLSGKLYAKMTDGKREYFYEDGTLKTIENYSEDRLHGLSQLFWPDGKLKRRSFFEKGVRHGRDEMWSEEGILVDEGQYEKGKPIGIHRRYNLEGRLIEEIEYLDAVRFNLREWNDEGEIKVEAQWRDFDYHERAWDRFKNVWVEKEGTWNGKKLVYV